MKSNLLFAASLLILVGLLSCKDAKDPVAPSGTYSMAQADLPPCGPGPGIGPCVTPTPLIVPNCPDCPCTGPGPGIAGVPACTPTPTPTPTPTATPFVGPGIG